MLLNRELLYRKYGLPPKSRSRIDLHEAKQAFKNKAFTGINDLTNVCFANSQLAEIDKKTFNGLTKLVEITLPNNKLQYIDKDTFQGLNSLAFISLHNNQLKRLHRHTFLGLTSLAFLYLSNNQIKKIETDIFNGLTNLTGIYLGHNQINQIEKETFHNLNNLKVISLHNNLLNEINKDTFSGLTNLTHIYLYGNQLTYLDKELFTGLVNLSEIHLNYNKLKRLHSQAFHGLKKLKEINLSGNELEKIDKDTFHGLFSLTIIWLNNNQLNQIDKQTFSGLTNLTHIYMSNNQISTDKLVLNIEKSVRFVSFKNEWNENNRESIIKQTFKTLLINNRFVFGSKYKINGPKLGEGMFGKVYKTENILDKNNKTFALKIMKKKTNKNPQEVFLSSKDFRDIKILCNLPESEFMMNYEDCFFDSIDCVCIVLEFCEGGTLAKRIKAKLDSRKKFCNETINRWTKQMVLGAAFLHDNKIIHQDIKPTNVFFKNGIIKLGDIGVSNMNQVSYDHTIIDSTPYKSPEMLQINANGKKISYKTDIWSIGIILYELITLRRPYDYSKRKTIQDSIIYGPLPELNRSAPEHFKILVKMMLQKAPEKRAETKYLKQALDSLDFLAKFISSAK